MSQEFDNKVLDLPTQKWFYPYEYMRDFEKFKEKSPIKERFYSSLTTEKLVTKNMNMFLMFGKSFRWRRWKISTTCIENMKFYC